MRATNGNSHDARLKGRTSSASIMSLVNIAGILGRRPQELCMCVHCNAGHQARGFSAQCATYADSVGDTSIFKLPGT